MMEKEIAASALDTELVAVRAADVPAAACVSSTIRRPSRAAVPAEFTRLVVEAGAVHVAAPIVFKNFLFYFLLDLLDTVAV